MVGRERGSTGDGVRPESGQPEHEGSPVKARKKMSGDVPDFTAKEIRTMDAAWDRLA
jgi:hypothetical protein